MRRSPLLLSAILLVACGGAKQIFDLTGTWHGRLTQHGLSPFFATATIRDLESPSANTVHYSGIDCGGHWSYLGRAGSAFRFREVIDSGRSTTCKGTGTVTLTPAGADHVRYVFRGGGIVSRGVLSRR